MSVKEHFQEYRNLHSDALVDGVIDSCLNLEKSGMLTVDDEGFLVLTLLNPVPNGTNMVDKLVFKNKVNLSMKAMSGCNKETSADNVARLASSLTGVPVNILNKLTGADASSMLAVTYPFATL